MRILDWSSDVCSSDLKIVDKLLSSPGYGEKMTLHWLDVSRYADSYGYQDDQYRGQWPWRDWVIHAFNENMPYDQFLLWQLAGDMLPGATKEQILARSEEHTSELQSLMRISYAVFCLQKKNEK